MRISKRLTSRLKPSYPRIGSIGALQQLAVGGENGGAREAAVLGPRSMAAATVLAEVAAFVGVVVLHQVLCLLLLLARPLACRPTYPLARRWTVRCRGC
jgi:hypothetical protein